MSISDKIKHLDKFLSDKYKVKLNKILNIEESTFNEYIKTDNFSQKDIENICGIFYLDVNEFLDINKDLPHDDHLHVDELLIKINQGNYVNDLGKNSNKHVIKRNYLLLNENLRKKLIINTICTVIPFLLIVIYLFSTSLTNVITTLEEYSENNTLSSEQKALKDKLDNSTNTNYANVSVGVVLESIKGISSSTSSFETTLSCYFDFDQIEYYKMYYKKEKGIEFDTNSFYNEDDYLADNFCFDSTNNSYLEYKDNIPDIIQFNFKESTHMSQDNKPISVSTLYNEQLKAYPGEKSSNVYSDKNDEFRIGNGKIVSDSLEYEDKGNPYFDSKTKSFRYYQKLHFTASINKTFDNPRYPLDSSQFKIYIEPTRSSEYVRYIKAEESCLSTYFSIGNGYRLIKEKNNLKNFNINLNYYKELDVDTSSNTYGFDVIKTELEIVVRANKHGIAIYLNSFLNILAVSIWLLLAFYNQSFNKDDSMSMIGTGFFSAISAILLGLNSVGSANTNSLLTYVNIFTLLMVLVIGYESIKAKRYNKLNDANMLAYSNAKMRILFYTLLICAILIFVVIPLISYIWFI